MERFPAHEFNELGCLTRDHLGEHLGESDDRRERQPTDHLEFSEYDQGARTDVRIEHVITNTPPVRADPLRLRQVLRNLVNNAVRYGGSNIRVESVVTTDTVAICVSDDGDGVSEHLAETIFEPFFSAHDRAGQPDALGLGLSVVRTLTEAMDSTVALNVEDGWTVFTVEFPIA